ASLRVRATAALQPGESITLVVAAGYTEGALEEVARALDQLSTLAPARASVTNRIERERVSLRSPWGWLNDDWTWALQQLDSLMVEAPAGLHTPLTGWAADPDIAPRFKTGEAVVAGLAALSAGDHDTAHQLIEFLATTQNSSGEIAAGGKLTGTLEFTDHNAARQFLLLVAQYFAWTGEIGCVRRVWVHVRRAVASGQFNQVDAEGAAAVLRQLSQTAEAIGEREDGVAFKAHADQRVPGVSAQSQTPWQSLWSIVEHDDEFTAGPGFAIAPVIYGFCGAVPDAARNRIELKTEIPLGWEFLELNNLRVGDNRFSFEYRRQGLSHSFRLRPLAGAVPLRVILEPALFATGIRQVSVDGQDAQLDIRRVGNRWICPLQIVVDHDREIVIEASDSEDA
ncbi:MAG: hypothetical protein ACREMA_11255, partial [Longimicrobiales bacterium]